MKAYQVLEVAKSLPSTFGIYKMLGHNEDILYIGKAINIANRVAQHANPSSKRLALMIEKTSRIEATITASENDALLLEHSLIKSLKPKYNILLRDDKSFSYIAIKQHPYPRFLKSRQSGNFGPFVSGIDEIIETLNFVFKLRSCKEANFSNRRRPCLMYFIGKCSAPCVDKISEKEYCLQLNKAVDILQGKHEDLIKDLNKQMSHASKKQDFEMAAIYRDQLRAIEKISKRQAIYCNDLVDCDLICILSDMHVACIQMYVYRNGGNIASKVKFYHNQLGFSEDELLDAFFCDTYIGGTFPSSIMTNIPLSKTFEENISHTKSASFKIYENSTHNAMLALIENTKYLLEQHKNTSKHFMFKELQDFLQMDELSVIDVFDNSHLSGSNPYAVKVRATQEGFIKSEYRLLKFESTSDDLYMLSRMLNAQKYEDKGHLVIIDGGQTHLSLAKNICATAISVSKGPKRKVGQEMIHTFSLGSFKADLSNPAIKFILFLRDEAHRFAISTQRKSRNL